MRFLLAAHTSDAMKMFAVADLEETQHDNPIKEAANDDDDEEEEDDNDEAMDLLAWRARALQAEEELTLVLEENARLREKLAQLD